MSITIYLELNSGETVDWKLLLYLIKMLCKCIYVCNKDLSSCSEQADEGSFLPASDEGFAMTNFTGKYLNKYALGYVFWINISCSALLFLNNFIYMFIYSLLLSVHYLKLILILNNVVWKFDKFHDKTI